MREILFRGKEVESGDWYYGDIFHSSVDVDTVRIHDYRNRANVKIIPDTLGQFTGLTDKNGVKIFEGDIVSLGDVNYPVIFNTLGECAEFALTDGVPFGFDYIHVPMEVVGNIYDNPELIGGGENE